MDPLVGSALISGVGGLVGGLLGQSGARQQMAFNARQAQLNRDFQERMSSTAHQRAVADLRKAGLNPILSATQGGASTPSGSQASSGLNPKEILAHSAAQLALTTAQARKANTEADANSYNAEFSKLKAEGLQQVMDLFKSGAGGSGNPAGIAALAASLLGFKLPKMGKGKSKSKKPNQTAVNPLPKDKPLPKKGSSTASYSDAAKMIKAGYAWDERNKKWVKRR